MGPSMRAAREGRDPGEAGSGASRAAVNSGATSSDPGDHPGELALAGKARGPLAPVHHVKEWYPEHRRDGPLKHSPDEEVHPPGPEPLQDLLLGGLDQDLEPGHHELPEPLPGP